MIERSMNFYCHFCAHSTSPRLSSSSHLKTRSFIIQLRYSPYSFSNLYKYVLLFFSASSLYIFIPFHSFQYMRSEKEKKRPLNHLLQLCHTHGYIFQQCQVGFICRVAVIVQVALSAEQYVCG